ncbi:MAG: hypothetical protein AVO33_00660 [delta proteobacterium ML8_F1]|nr:MAG: hypothetical protein AVO33_00660 [delta proteobacterium ML8_F1]
MKARIMMGVFVFLGLMILLFVAFPWMSGDCCPVRLGMGIIRLGIGEAQIVPYARGLNQDYLVSRSDLQATPLKQWLEEKGWRFKEQMGAGYLFEKEDDSGRTLMVTGRQFTRHYRTWQVPRPYR